MAVVGVPKELVAQVQTLFHIGEERALRAIEAHNSRQDLPMKIAKEADVGLLVAEKIEKFLRKTEDSQNHKSDGPVNIKRLIPRNSYLHPYHVQERCQDITELNHNANSTKSHSKPIQKAHENNDSPAQSTNNFVASEEVILNHFKNKVDKMLALGVSVTHGITQDEAITIIASYMIDGTTINKAAKESIVDVHTVNKIFDHLYYKGIERHRLGGTDNSDHYRGREKGYSKLQAQKEDTTKQFKEGSIPIELVEDTEFCHEFVKAVEKATKKKFYDLYTNDNTRVTFRHNGKEYSTSISSLTSRLVHSDKFPAIETAAQARIYIGRLANADGSAAIPHNLFEDPGFCKALIVAMEGKLKKRFDTIQVHNPKNVRIEYNGNKYETNMNAMLSRLIASKELEKITTPAEARDYIIATANLGMLRSSQTDAVDVRIASKLAKAFKIPEQDAIMFLDLYVKNIKTGIIAERLNINEKQVWRLIGAAQNLGAKKTVRAPKHL